MFKELRRAIKERKLFFIGLSFFTCLLFILLLLKNQNIKTVSGSFSNESTAYKAGPLQSITFKKKLLNSFDNTNLKLLTQKYFLDNQIIIPRTGFYLSTSLISDITQMNGKSTNKTFYLITIMDSKTRTPAIGAFDAIDNEGNLYTVIFAPD